MTEYEYGKALIESGDLKIKKHKGHKVVDGLDNLILTYKYAKSRVLNDPSYEKMVISCMCEIIGYADALVDAGILSKHGMRRIWVSLGWRESIYEE